MGLERENMLAEQFITEAHKPENSLAPIKPLFRALLKIASLLVSHV